MEVLQLGNYPTKSIDEQIISMILPQHLHLAGFRSQGITIQKKSELDACLDCSLENRDGADYIPSAAATAAIDGMWKPLSFDLDMSARTDSTITTKLTEAMLQECQPDTVQ